MEKSILSFLFKQDSSLEQQESSQIYIEMSIENTEILSMIEEYISINYLRYYNIRL